MATIIGDKTLTFGIPKVIPPLAGFPPGKVRLRIRNDEFPRAFYRDMSGQFVHCHISSQSGHWWPSYTIGINK